MNNYPYLSAGNFHIFNEQQNSILCYQAQDKYFECLDQNNVIGANPLLCPKQHNQWKADCDEQDRKYHILNRRIQKQNEQLYTQKELREYNKLKNRISG
ncbi:hypothetical protein pb186bvf_011928 [Paramecium bursaria]